MTRSLRVTFLAAASAALLTLSACGSSADKADAPTDEREVILMLNWTPNAHHAGIYHAQAEGLYKDHGIKLNIVEPSADVGVETVVAQGRADIGIAQAESLLPARAAGMDVTAIATLLPKNDSVLMGLADSGLKADDPGTLAGLSYGGYGGALETEIMSELVRCAGKDPKSVEFIDIGNVDYLAGLEKKRFDVTWVFGGWDALRASKERDDVVTLALSDFPDCIPNWDTPILLASAEKLADDPELVKDFLAATSEGYDRAASDPAAAAASLLKGAPELDEDLVNSAVEYYSDKFGVDKGFGRMDETTWTRFTDFLVQAKMIDNSSVLQGAWSNDFLPAAP